MSNWFRKTYQSLWKYNPVNLAANAVTGALGLGNTSDVANSLLGGEVLPGGTKMTPEIQSALLGAQTTNTAELANKIKNLTGFNIPESTRTEQKKSIDALIAQVMANMQQGSTGASAGPLFAGKYGGSSFIPTTGIAGANPSTNVGLIQRYGK